MDIVKRTRPMLVSNMGPLMNSTASRHLDQQQTNKDLQRFQYQPGHDRSARLVGGDTDIIQAKHMKSNMVSFTLLCRWDDGIFERVSRVHAYMPRHLCINLTATPFSVTHVHISVEIPNNTFIYILNNIDALNSFYTLFSAGLRTVFDFLAVAFSVHGLLEAKEARETKETCTHNSSHQTHHTTAPATVDDDEAYRSWESAPGSTSSVPSVTLSQSIPELASNHAEQDQQYATFASVPSRPLYPLPGSSMAMVRRSRRSIISGPECKIRGCDAVPGISSRDTLQDDSATSTALFGYTERSSSGFNGAVCGVDRLFADRARDQEDSDSPCVAYKNPDVHTNNSTVDDTRNHSQFQWSSGLYSIHHDDGSRPGILTGNAHASQRAQRVQDDLDDQLRCAPQATRENNNKLRTNIDQLPTPRDRSSQKGKASVKVIPCPIQNCPGRNYSISEILRKLKNSQHNKFICQNCWRVFMTLEDLNGHTLCEDYCVIKRCDSATSQDVRHRYNRGSCMEKGDAGGFREARKEDEYQYLCGLLGVSPRALYEGLETPHKGQRKSPNKKEAHDVAVQISEAKRLNETLELKNQDLQRHNGELETSVRAHCDRSEELMCIIQQVLEELGGKSPRMSNALHRRIERHAPGALEGFLHGISDCGDVAARNLHWSSAPSVHPQPGSLSSHNLYQDPKRETHVTDWSTESPIRQMALNQDSMEEKFSGSVTNSLRSTPIQIPFIDEMMVDTPQHRRQHESSFRQSMPAQTRSSELGAHRAPEETTTPLRLSSPHLAMFTDFPSEIWGSATLACQPQHSMGDDPVFSETDFSAISNDKLMMQESSAWDDYAFAGLLSATMYTGEGSFNEDFFGDTSMG